MSSHSHDIVLHATPPFGGLPASDVESLYLAAVLQSALPGRWAITSGEWATNGGKCGSRRVCKALSLACRSYSRVMILLRRVLQRVLRRVVILNSMGPGLGSVQSNWY